MSATVLEIGIDGSRQRGGCGALPRGGVQLVQHVVARAQQHAVAARVGYHAHKVAPVAFAVGLWVDVVGIGLVGWQDAGESC